MVAENYLDARGGGFDPAAWDALCQRVLSGPLRDRAAAHRCALQGLVGPSVWVCAAAQKCAAQQR